MNLLVLLLPVLVFGKADYYYRPCSKLLMKTYAYGTAMKGMDEHEMYSDLCATMDFQASLGQCIYTAAGLTNAGESELDSMYEVSWEYFKYICSYYGTKRKYSWPQVEENFLHDPITGNYSSRDTRIQITDDQLLSKNVPETGRVFYRARHDPIAFGWGIVFYIVIVIGVQSILNVSIWFAPRTYRRLMQFPVVRSLRFWFALPPLLGRHASKRLRNFSQRLHYVWIGGFIILNIAFSFAGYDGYTYSPLYYMKDMAMWSAYAFRAGYLAMYMLPISFLFATRNNLLIILTGWDMNVFNLWHRWISRLVIIHGVVHAVAYHLMYKADGTLGSKWCEAFWIFGFIALMAMALMATHGTKQLRQLAYDLFVLLHIALAILCLIGLHIHLWYTQQTKAAWYLCVGFWCADRFLRLARIAINGLGLVATIHKSSHDTITINIPCRSALARKPGSFVFVHFWHPIYFWQSHPFTVVPCSDPHNLKLIVKPRNGATKWLMNKVSSSDGSAQLRAFVDGPYGVPLNFDAFDTISFIAGGIGITAIHAHLKSITPEAIQTKSISVDWLITNSSAIDYFAAELAEMESLGLQLKIHITNSDSGGGSQIVSGSASLREDDLDNKEATQVTNVESTCPCSTFDSEKAWLIEKSESVTQLDRIVMLPVLRCQKSLAYFICGPCGLNRDARAQATLQAEMSTKYIQIYDESFSM